MRILRAVHIRAAAGEERVVVRPAMRGSVCCALGKTIKFKIFFEANIEFNNVFNEQSDMQIGIVNFLTD